MPAGNTKNTIKLPTPILISCNQVGKPGSPLIFFPPFPLGMSFGGSGILTFVGLSMHAITPLLAA